MKITLYTLMINIVLNILLILKLSYFGIALGTSIAAWVSVVIQIIYLRKSKLIEINRSTYLYVIKSNFCSLIMFIIVSISLFYTKYMIYTNLGIFNQILGISINIIFGITSYFTMIFLFGMFKNIQDD
jgi:peptidoglycan biosynthesis protein MviN/MurJ (putative lipid II flippase)